MKFKCLISISMEEVAKYSRKILIAWIGAIVVTMLSWGIALHDNARQGRSVAKEVALQTLRGVAERVVNREFERLWKIPVETDAGGVGR